MLKMPIRTCVSCKKQIAQRVLNRFQCIDKKIFAFTKQGRSFYICDDCLSNEKQLEKSLYRHCKNKDNYIIQIREILANG
jgi:predicted RNA-binding protein YlxR (DUF448 family)